ncbi:PAAR domain-containing protein [Deinococcus sp. Arct2-2]|uniref:PAAR domain-containing protein n=1 Tax=Deinococcus sp. Arct2-2 TaxID=2568653 RepID=UPI0010A41D85|nr:PAAR domain-containing protein [Deinococcus sp. Arct2-2]THF69538.1 PAAR domain-containing protein [Deinococcus sp. Arct2-2]
MPSVHRVGDPSIHGGVVTTGAVTVRAGGIPVARLGDPCPEPFHGPQVIITGSPTVRAEGKPIARQSDKLGCLALLTPTQFTVNAS